MRTLYRDYQSAIAPGCLQRPNGRIIERDFGIEKDVQQDRAGAGMLAAIPGQGPVDVLPYIGAERKLPRAVGESDVAYAERMRTTWTAPDGWNRAGSWPGMLFALARAGFPQGDPNGLHIMQRIKRYAWLTAGVVTFGTHPTWNSDGSPTNIWTQFSVVIGADFTPPIGSTFQDGDPSADLLNSIVHDWKPSKWRFMGTWVMVAGPFWDWPVGAAWNDGGRNWGDGLTTGVVRYVKP